MTFAPTRASAPLVLVYCLGTLVLTSLAVPVAAQVSDPAEIILVEGFRQVYVFAGADEQSESEDDISATAGPFVAQEGIAASGNMGSSSWAQGWQSSDISNFSIRGEGGGFVSAALGGGSEADVGATAEITLSVEFTVTEDTPFSLSAMFETSLDAPSTLGAPSGSVALYIISPDFGLQVFSHSYVDGGKEPPTYNASGFIEADSQITFTTFVYAGRDANGGEFDTVGEATAYFETLLTFGDRDGDGLLDQWEEEGIDFTGPGLEIDLPSLGADPDHKDLFVEVDQMSGVAIDGDAFDLVVAAFANAPADMVSSAHKSRDYFGSASLRDHPEAEQIMDFRKRIFRYGLWADTLTSGKRTSGGKANGIPGQDFIVAAGSVASKFSNLTTTALAGGFMHEFGHSLGLRHGGQENANRKPNYISVMNYTYIVPYLIDGEIVESLLPLWQLDYSRETIRTLDELSLEEADGLDGPPGRYVVFNSAASRRVLLRRGRVRHGHVRARRRSGRAHEGLEWQAAAARDSRRGRVFRRDGAHGLSAPERNGARPHRLSSPRDLGHRSACSVQARPRAVRDHPDEHGPRGQPPTPRSRRALDPRRLWREATSRAR